MLTGNISCNRIIACTTCRAHTVYYYYCPETPDDKDALVRVAHDGGMQRFTETIISGLSTV